MQKKIKGTELVEKSNALNAIRCNEMTLQELRFFSIYLAKINARDLSTRVVKFPLSDFQKIMDFGRLNIKQLQEATDRLLCKVVNIPNERGGYTGFVLFNEVTIDKDENNEWYVEINAHDKALPLMFELKGKYFKYKLWNVLKLKSVSQLRMYEILKQHEREKKFEIKMLELRELLGIAPNQYQQLERFRTRVIDSCQKALAENTDICFTYERGKTGPHGKWLTIVFNICKNKNYKDPIALENFINIRHDEEEYTQSEQIQKLAEEPVQELPPKTCGFHSFETDFTQEEIQTLTMIINAKLSAPDTELANKILRAKYAECKLTCPDAEKPFAYFLTAITKMSVEEFERKKPENNDGFDADEYEMFLNNF